MDINSKESISVNTRTVTSEPERLIYFLNLEQNIIASVPYGGPKVSRQFQFDHGNFNFTHGNLNFVPGNFFHPF